MVVAWLCYFMSTMIITILDIMEFSFIPWVNPCWKLFALKQLLWYKNPNIFFCLVFGVNHWYHGMFVLSTSNHTYLDMVDCLSLEKVMKKNEKLFALKQLFWFFKNWMVLMVLTANHINHDMVVLDHLTHTHHKPIGLYCPIGLSKTCWVTLYIKYSWNT